MSLDPPTLWSSFAPTRIEFGAGSLRRVGELAQPLGRSAYLVAAGSAHRAGAVAKCQEALAAAAIEVTIHDGTIDPNPTTDDADRLAGDIASSECEVVIALGGGSVIDCTKAAAALAAEGGSAGDYLAGSRGPVAVSLPVVAIPTTAGTGAELSKGAILTWEERGIKGGMRGEGLLPKVAIIDPELTLTVPVEQTKYTGFDAFAHAVETFISRRATPLTELFSSAAVQGIVANLPATLADPSDLAARSQMAFFASLMGYNLANSSTCLPHRLQYPIGARTKTAHGLGLAALFPAWIRTTRGASPERFETVAGWMQQGMGDQTSDVEQALAKFMEHIDLEPSLADLGVLPGDLSEIAVATSGSLGNDPWWTEGADLESLLGDAMNGTGA